MEGQHDRASSPSTSQHQNHAIGHQPSPPHFSKPNSLSLDPSSPFDASAFEQGIPPAGPEQFNFPNNYLNSTSHGPSFQQQIGSNEYSGQDMGQSLKRNSVSNGSQKPSDLNLQSSNHQFPGEFTNQFAGQDLRGKQDSPYSHAFMLDPSLEPSSQQNPSINPADVMGNLSPLSSPPGHMQMPANLMQVDQMPSTQSPPIQQGQYYSPGHSRHASLDPVNAGFSHGQQPADWSGMMGGQSFQHHRRAPSEHSDVSSSVAPSPFLPQQEGFDPFQQNHSPLLPAQQDNLYQDSLGIERFTISEGQHQRQGLSPRHTPYPSPRMSPHPGSGIGQENPFILPSNDVGSLGGGSIYNQSESPYPEFRMKSDSGDMGQAAQMAPPEINVELAPPSGQTVESSRSENDHDTLSPPDSRGWF
jgi:hypothetical protein